MQLKSIRNIYDAEGPFATVYFEGRSPGEDSAQQVKLRWQALRDQIAEQGAATEMLSALDDALLVEDITEVQTDGRVLVATADGIQLDAPWDAALGVGDAAHLGSEPELGAYVRELARSVRLLVAVADQQGAVVRQVVVAQDHSVDGGDEQEVTGDAAEGVHHPRGQALSHKRIQRRADEAVKQNTQGVADHLGSSATSWKPDALVLAGEVQGRAALRDALSKNLAAICRETDKGGLDDDGAEQILADELRRVADEIATQRAIDRTERYEQAKGHHQAAEDARSVARALEMAAVETLLFNYDQEATSEATLLAAAARTDAEVDLVDTELSDGVAAILRFEAPQEVNT